MRATMGVFPALMDPARKAARLVLAGPRSRQPISGKPGFGVALRGAVAEGDVFFVFEQDGREFVIFEEINPTQANCEG